MKRFIPSLAAILSLSLTAGAAPVGSAFTWQGRLNQNGAPASGSFDLRFELYDVAAGGAPVVAAVERLAQPITNGLFSTELDFGGPVVFDGTAYWLAILARVAGAPDYIPVPGRTAIRPAPYALHALNAGAVKDGSVTSSSLVNGAVTAEKLAPAAVGLAQLNAPANPNAGQVLAFDGNNLSWINGGGGGVGGPWLLSGTTAFYSAGRVGIGTSTAGHSLSIGGGPLWTSNQWIGSVELPNASAIGWKANAGGQRFGLGQTNTGLYFFRTASDPGTTASPAIYDMYINDGGNVIMTGGGLGFFTVGAPNGETGHSLQRDGGRADIRFNGTSLKLVAHAVAGPPPAASGIEISTAGAVTMTGGGPGIVTFGSPNGESGSSIQRGGSRGDVRFDGTSIKLVAGPGVGPPGSLNGVAVNTSGNVGIGITTPAHKLHVVGAVLATTGIVIGNNPGTNDAPIYSDNTASTRVVLWNYARNGLMDMVCQKGDVSSLTIRGGADIAEPFAMSHDGVEPGSVVVIDEKNPGKLKASTRAYDKRVAGIVSGANGIKPGISMIQEDKLEAGENVALSGRVYVKADTNGGSIEPGDLLTTSSAAGRAMKASDHDKAQGAIIGKAMTPLTDADGMVLVLVTLQ